MTVLSSAIFAKAIKADKYRKGVPPAFPESQPKYLQDELTKLERVFDLHFDDTVNVVASVQHEVTERKEADAALASDILTLTAATSKASADISSELTARVEGDKANADALVALTTTVGGHTTSITQHTESINGLSARWGVKINNNNRVAGVQLNSAADGTSSFDIEANTLNLFKPGTNEKMVYWDGVNLVVRGNILATSITADAIKQQINAVGDAAINRPVVGNPNVIAQGTFQCNEQGGSIVTTTAGGGVTYSDYYSFTVFIPTGVLVDSSWSVASTSQYLATATIAGGTMQNGGHIGYSEVSVVVGDGLGAGTPTAQDNQIYIKYVFNPNKLDGGFGGFNATSISWKLVRV